MEDILWGIINSQNYEVHQFRNYLAGHDQYGAVTHDGTALNATSLGEHCDSTLDTDVTVTITINGMTPTATSSISGCTASATHFCMKVALHAGEADYYEFE